MKAENLLYNISKIYQNLLSGTHFSEGVNYKALRMHKISFSYQITGNNQAVFYGSRHIETPHGIIYVQYEKKFCIICGLVNFQQFHIRIISE